MTETTFGEALRWAMEDAMEADDSVFVMAEGVDDEKSVFGTTAGLRDKFGADRVVEMPNMEAAGTGIAVGAAMVGRRPVMVHQRVEFSLLAAEQIIDNAAKIPWLTGGQFKVPMVIRMIIGRGWGQGPTHGQSLEHIWAGIPGLKVYMPSTPQQAYLMLHHAIADDGPVIFLEHRWLYSHKADVKRTRHAQTVEAWPPRHARAGADLTIVAAGYMVHEALKAAELLEINGIFCDVFDLRSLRPLELTQIVRRVGATGRLLCVENGHLHCSVGATVVAAVTSAAMSNMIQAPVVLACNEHPLPSSAALAEDYYPSVQNIVETGLQMCGSRVSERLEKALGAYYKQKPPSDVPDNNFGGPF